ncbi:hypothetical protein [Rhodoblastus sp.]|uniref:hypothetical protein n=1 Tax=Rhodoblastus sp. TaxID=1962975 RepID=UPI003F9B169D
MVAVAHRHADEYVRNPQAMHHLFLVFGPDTGLVCERARALLLRDGGEPPNMRRETVSLTGDAIASDPNLLLDEIHSLRLFDHAPSAIRVSVGNRNLIPAFELVAKSTPFEARIVVEAGPLKRTAPLRKWFESQSLAAAIECYADQPQDLRRLIDQQISSCGASIESEAAQMLLGMLGEDRLLSRLEIEKLCLYTNGQHAITSNDVIELLAASTSVDGGEIIQDAILGNLDSMIGSMSSLAMNVSDCNSFSMNALRHILAVHLARAQVSAGMSRDAALQTLIRSLNAFKRKQELSVELNLQGSADAAGLVYNFYDLVRELRHSGLMIEVKLSHALTALAHSGRKRKRGSSYAS